MARRRHGRPGASNSGKSRGRRRGPRDVLASVPGVPRPTAGKLKHHRGDDGAPGSCPRCLMDLPNEILLVIMEHGGAHVVGCLAQTCRRLAILGRDDTLWRRLCFLDPSELAWEALDCVPHPRRGWRWLYRAHTICVDVTMPFTVGWGYIPYALETRYAGEWSYGTPCGYGYGTYRLHDGLPRLLQGRWKDGVPHGFCIQYTEGREVGRGCYRNGERHGMWKVEFTPGWSYEGPFRNGLHRGMGVERYADGGHYRGHFYKGFRQGQGTLTLPDGTTRCGRWKGDSLVVALPPAL
ncbi:F-box domain containing protein [Pandoravirus quercus]|uniref:F-box domain containing protein n=1 Tax=Pandoravirus quercus TaxID=2107709 RepID=A0A2U7UAD2_9VIRU|nr:F-box domain containing protein [Pandoravirus quercus]AVK75340.1 F-box domain containing protein [Pandoravirus quercus]